MAKGDRKRKEESSDPVSSPQASPGDKGRNSDTKKQYILRACAYRSSGDGDTPFIVEFTRDRNPKCVCVDEGFFKKEGRNNGNTKSIMNGKWYSSDNACIRMSGRMGLCDLEFPQRRQRDGCARTNTESKKEKKNSRSRREGHTRTHTYSRTEYERERERERERDRQERKVQMSEY